MATEVGDVCGNLADLLTAAAAQHPTAAAVITDARSYTWSELNAAADRGAAALVELGFRPGDRLISHLPTGPALLAAHFAGARAGMLLVPIEPSREDIGVIAGRVGAGGIVTADRVTDPGLPVITEATVTGWLDATGPAVPFAAVGGGEDIAILARASRSDRAVMLSHRAVLAAVASIAATPSLVLRAEDRVLLVLPAYHLAGFVTAFLPLTVVGGAAVIPSTPDISVGRSSWREYTGAVLDAISRHRVTVLPGAPALYQLLLRADGLERSLASVRLLTSGASPLDAGDFSAVRARTGSPVWEGYGISEAASAVASSLMTKAPRAGSVGLPLPGVELRIEDTEPSEETEPGSTLLDLNAGEPGRICIRGAHLFSGYWPDGDGGPDAEGWWTTGDVGYFDDSGELHLVDRAAEAITVAGFTVYPREVEVALSSHPYVRDVAVVGLPSKAGEDLVAVIIPRTGTTPTAEDLTEYLTGLLPAFKRPVRYQLVDRIPRTEVSRLDRDALRRDLAATWGITLEPRTDHRLTVVGAAPVVEDVPVSEEQVQPTVEVSPEPVPELDELGTRLPGIGGRANRSADDTDEDMFDDELL